MRRSSLLLPVVIFLGVTIGGSLYLYGGSLFNDPAAMRTASGFSYTVIAQGSDALGIDEQANYRIKNEADMASLWQLMYGTGTTAPYVDFSNYEVLAVFNGTHSTSGYSVSIDDIQDTRDARRVSIIREEPGSACSIETKITSPYILVQVPVSPLPLERSEKTIVTACE